MRYRDKILSFGKPINSGTSDSILSSLYRIILTDLGMDYTTFEKLVMKYIVSANLTPNLHMMASTRGNLKKELLKSVMSWKIFIKGLLFLNVKEFSIKITLHHASGKVTEHNKFVILNQGMADTPDTPSNDEEGDDDGNEY